MTADECVFQDGCCGLPPGDYSRRLMLNRKAYWDPGRTNVMSAPSLSREGCKALRSRRHSIPWWHRRGCAHRVIQLKKLVSHVEPGTSNMTKDLGPAGSPAWQRRQPQPQATKAKQIPAQIAMDSCVPP